MAEKCDVCRELDELMVAIVPMSDYEGSLREGLIFPRSHAKVQQAPLLFARWLDGQPGLDAAREKLRRVTDPTYLLTKARAEAAARVAAREPAAAREAAP